MPDKKIPTDTYRVFTDLDGNKQLHYIAPDGFVLPLEPKPEDMRRRDGYYTREFKLIRLTPLPIKIIRAMKRKGSMLG